MDVFPDLIGEKEFSYFTPTDYNSLKCVLNDSLARDVRKYMNNPAANPAVVTALNDYLGDTLESLTMHYTLKEKGIFDLVRGLVPENLPTSRQDLNVLIEQLTFLEENESKLLTTVPARKRADYDRFISTMRQVLGRIAENGDHPTYPNIMQRIDDNKFVFYIPNEKEHETGSRIISINKRKWVTTLRGAQYIQRCNEENIPYVDRRKF